MPRYIITVLTESSKVPVKTRKEFVSFLPNPGSDLPNPVNLCFSVRAIHQGNFRSITGKGFVECLDGMPVRKAIKFLREKITSIPLQWKTPKNDYLMDHLTPSWEFLNEVFQTLLNMGRVSRGKGTFSVIYVQ